MENEQFQRVAKALADPRRFEILALIAEHGEINCGGMAEQMPVSQPTVSHHLKELVTANLVAVRAEGQSHIFSLCENTVRQYIDELSGLLLAKK